MIITFSTLYRGTLILRVICVCCLFVLLSLPQNSGHFTSMRDQITPETSSLMSAFPFSLNVCLFVRWFSHLPTAHLPKNTNKDFIHQTRAEWNTQARRTEPPERLSSSSYHAEHNSRSGHRKPETEEVSEPMDKCQENEKIGTEGKFSNSKIKRVVTTQQTKPKQDSFTTSKQINVLFTERNTY